MMGPFERIVLATSLLGIGSFFPPPARCQPPEMPAVTAPDEAEFQATEEQIEQWIAALGADEFADREIAASNLVAGGDRVLSRLREVARKSPDLEVRLRAGEIVRKLVEGDLGNRIESFLKGADVPFEGWDYFQNQMGDSISVRELFVDVLKSHPKLIASLAQEPRDRAIALKSTVSEVENKIYKRRQFPDGADAVALLLPAADKDVPLEGGYEDILLSVLQKPAVTQLHRDARLSGPFGALLGKWLPRSSLGNREEILFYGLGHGIQETHKLAMQTLGEAQHAETLTLAFQAIAKFGNRDDAAKVAVFLDDKRPAAERGFANGRRFRTEVRDVAMATIARLYGRSLDDIGFTRESFSGPFSFLIDDLGFPIDKPDAREAARGRIEELLLPAPPKEGS